MLDGLATRAVVPLWRREAWRGAPIRVLQPALEVNGEQVVARFDQVTHIPKAALGAALTNVAEARKACLDALDLLFAGF